MPEDKNIRPSNQGFSITAEQRPSRHHATGHTPKSAGTHAVTGKSSGVGYFVSSALFVLLTGVAAAGYWQLTELQKDLVETRQALLETRDQLGLVTGQVSQTGETIDQSDSNFRSELKVVNSEIRKLWDVSNKRNRQWINENKEKIAQESKNVVSAAKQADVAKRLSEQAVSQLTELDQMVKAVATEQLVANSDMTAHVEAMKAEIDGLKNTLSTLQSIEQRIQTSAQTQEELSKKLSSFQSQISLRLLQLENTVRDLGKPKDKGVTIQGL